MLTLLDREIARITQVMRPSLHVGAGSLILPVRYWRARFNRLLDSGHLTSAHLCSIDDLPLQLDRFVAEHHESKGQSAVAFSIRE
jgi:hypothetical protein